MRGEDGHPDGPRAATTGLQRGAPIALGVLVAVWIALFSVLAVRKHDHFLSVDFDMGIFDQATWLIAHGRGFITVRGLPVFGHHGNFGLALFAPAYWLGAGPNFLDVFQVVVLALGAVPVYLLARERRVAPWGAAALGAAFLLHPALQLFVDELFHPEAVGITPLLCAYLCVVRRSWRWFAVWSLATVIWKEDFAVVFVVLGLVIALRGDRRVGLVTAALAAAWFVGVNQLMIPLVSGHPAHYEGLYEGVGGSGTGIVRTAFTHPGRITGRVVSSETSSFGWKLIAPFGLAPLLAPVTLLFGLPQFLLDVVSDVPWTRTIEFRYAAIPLAAAAAAMVEAVAWLGRRLGRPARVAAPLVVLACALASSYAWGASPVARGYESTWAVRPSTRLDAKRAAVAMVPSDASVSATYNLVPHLSRRAEIYTYPNPWEPSNWGVPGSATRDPRRIEWVVADRRVLTRLERDRLTFRLGLEFEIVADHDDVVVARRRGP